VLKRSRRNGDQGQKKGRTNAEEGADKGRIKGVIKISVSVPVLYGVFVHGVCFFFCSDKKNFYLCIPLRKGAFGPSGV